MHIHQHNNDCTLGNAVLGAINTLYNKYNSKTGKLSLLPTGNISAPSARIRGTLLVRSAMCMHKRPNE